MKALITGRFGFIGSRLARKLIKKGYGVTIIDLYGAKPCVPIPIGNINIIYGSYSDQSVLEQCSDKIDICFHLASSLGPASSNNNIFTDIETNLIATIVLLNWLSAKQIYKIIYASSDGTVYGNNQPDGPISENQCGSPICSYGIIKKTIEDYLYLYSRINGIRYNILRFSNPYGIGQRIHNNQGVIANLIGKIINNKPIEFWGDGSVIRDYVYIDDVINATILQQKALLEEL